MSETVQYEADHGQGDHSLGDLGQLLVVLGQAPPSVEPAEGLLDQSLARQHDASLRARDTLDDDQGEAEQEAGEQRGDTIVAAVGEHCAQPVV